MIFCRVRRIKSIFHGKDLAIRGSHKCRGGILSFIIRAVVNIKIIKLFLKIILLKIIENIIIKDAMIWIIK